MLPNNTCALIVDDDPDMLQVSALALETLKIKEILHARDGAEAIKRIENSSLPVGLVLCDWMMPKMNGPEFLKAFRASNADAPFIMLTGQSSSDDFASVSTGPKDYFLTKQQSLNDIMDMVSEVLKQNAGSEA